MTINSLEVAKLVHSPRNGRQPGAFAPDSDYHQTADLEAQILEFGLIHAPTAHPMPGGKFGVFIGGRRLLALQRLIARGALPKDHRIDVNVRRETDLVLSEMSFAENATRVALPAVTEFETYARLMAEGADVAAIAHRYQTTELHVRQRMRLGDLHPDIRAELAADRLSLDMARAYGGTADRDLQKRIFDQRPTHPFEVKAAMKREATTAGVDRMLTLVGMDAYVGAGGRAEEDLFQTGDARLLDIDVLRGLYDAKLAAERARLCLPDEVALQFGVDGVGVRVDIEDDPTPEQRERLQYIDARLGVLDDYLDAIAEWDHDAPMPRLVALAGEEQSTVDNFQSERIALGREIDAIANATGWPDGPLIAVGTIAGASVKLTGYYRPLGWKPDVIATSVTVAPTAAAGRAAAPAAPAAAVGDTPKPVISGFRSDRHQFTGSGLYRQPEEVAREEHGLTKDGVEAMRSHHRQILASAMLGDPIAVRLSHSYLIFVLARGMLRTADAGAVVREGPEALGTDRLPSHDYDPAHVRADLAAQPGATTQRDAIERLRAADWMTEPDTAAALRLFTGRTAHVDKERAAACVAVAMLSRSLDLPGFAVPVHQVLAEHLNIEANVRDHWTPDVAFFSRLPKNRKLDALRFVDDALAKRLANLGTDDLNEAAAWIMSGDRAAADKYGLSRGGVMRAQAWVPAYLSFGAGEEEPDDDPEDADALMPEREAA